MEEHSLSKGVKGKVLIVDDEADTRELIHRLLQSEGFEVITASTGAEGIQRVEEDHP